MLKRPYKGMKEVIKLTSSLTDTPEAIVKQVLRHQYREAFKWCNRPYSPFLTLPHFGRFQIAIGPVRNIILNYYVPKMREEPHNEELKERFRFYWKLYKKAIKRYKYDQAHKKRRKGSRRSEIARGVQRENKSRTTDIQESRTDI